MYDDEGYVPYNYDVAPEDENGYDYSYDDYSETLVYLSYRDAKTNTYNVFVDYSASDVSISISTTEDDEEEEDDEDESGVTVWLLVTSIVLVIVLIFTLISLLIRDILRRMRRKESYARNKYSGKRRHYIRKLGLVESGASDAPAGGFGDGGSDWKDSSK